MCTQLKMTSGHIERVLMLSCILDRLKRFDGVQLFEPCSVASHVRKAVSTAVVVKGDVQLSFA
jgi:hypothetical protein